MKITGFLTERKGITGVLSLPIAVTGTLTIPYTMSAEAYEGDYEVTPRMYAQYLDTEGKNMRHDVTVYEIPVTYTTNPDGGQTVLIG